VADDAKILEEAFQAKVADFFGGQPELMNGGELTGQRGKRRKADVKHATQSTTESSPHHNSASPEPAQRTNHGPIVKPIRVRDKRHRAFVAIQACLVCGRQPSDAHHLRFLQPRALGRKVSDEYTVPLCRIHHRQLHQTGDEVGWWDRLKISPVEVARRLWQESQSGFATVP
jgi:hypothetical protein